jgi:hypothetical protein
MDEALLNEIEEARRMGAVFMLKWDGERSERVYTVILSHHEKQFMFRAETDDMMDTAREALQQLRQAIN